MKPSPPVIIVGAARSGTRLLRALIARGGQHVEVPHDVNYIWRYGNESNLHDCLRADQARPKVAQFIRRQLKKIAPASDRRPMVEKTVGNVLRLPFVYEVYPDARYVFLYRDGRDVIESAFRCWQSPPSVGHLRDKMKTFPWFACGRYAWRYVHQTAARTAGFSRHLASWGPRYEGIDLDVRNRPLLEVCCRQWVACMEAYDRDQSCLPTESLIQIRYEDLVRPRSATILRLAEFLRIADPQEMLSYGQTQIRQSAVGKYTRLSESEQSIIDSIAGDTLAKWGFGCATAVAA